jgi:hypothetical protein
MLRRLATALTVGLLSTTGVALAGPAQAVNIGNEGCTPGYWKNHPESWQEAGRAAPNTPLTYDHPSTAFPPFAPTFDLDGDGDADTFLDALNYKGGSGVAGAERILLRAAVAAWLNAAHEGVGYPLRRAALVAEVNAAIESGDRQTMLALAAELDRLNNLGCPL